MYLRNITKKFYWISMVVRFYVKGMLITSFPSGRSKTSVLFVQKVMVLYDSEVTAMCSLAAYRKLHLVEHLHPAGTSVGSVRYAKPVHSASHCRQWGHFFLACGQTILWKIHGYHSYL